MVVLGGVRFLMSEVPLYHATLQSEVVTGALAWSTQPSSLLLSSLELSDKKVYEP